MSTDQTQPTCLTCGHDATQTVAWIWADHLTAPFVRSHAWYGNPRPSCDFCADENAANLPTLKTTGPRVIGLHRIGDTA